MKTSVIKELINNSTNTNWLQQPCNFYELKTNGELITEANIEPLTNGQLKLSLTLKNNSLSPVEVQPSFPVIRGLSPGGNPEDLGYCFPQLIPEISTAVAQLKREYSSLFPLQFMNVFHQTAGSITLITQDSENNDKQYWLEKHQSGTVDLGVTYNNKTMQPNETWELPPSVIDFHSGDWHSGLETYRRWLKSWHTPATPRKQWLLNVFNFRQHFLHQNLGDKSWDEDKNQYHLYNYVQYDIEAFGGVDYVQLFDWATDPEHGRIGEYNPWPYLGGNEGLRKEVEKLQQDGIKVGAYLEGYLIDRRSTVAKQHGEEWTVKSKEGTPYGYMGEGYWYPCPHVSAWQQYLKDACVDVYNKLKVDGIYIDQYGWGSQYPCYSKDHGHTVPVSQKIGENEMMQLIRSNLPEHVVLLSEYMPTDVGTQYQDGSFTYCKELINLSRFAIPDFKQFVIIRCDEPIGEDYDSIKKIFFNGQGIWLEGPLSNHHWFPEQTRDLIKKCYLILKQNSDAFTSPNPEPLVPTLNPKLLANKFPTENKTVWTLYNTADEALTGELIKIPHQPNVEYHDAWNNQPLTPRIEGEKTYLTLTIKSKDTSCIIQKTNHS